MNLTSFPEAVDIVDRFIELLRQHGITPPVHSEIEGEMLSVTELLDLARNPASSAGRPSLLAEAGGIFDLAAKVLTIVPHPEFPNFIPHLRLFASKQRFATVAQTTTGNPTDDVRRKLAELYLGSLALHIGWNVELDDPQNSCGDNPDVMFDYMNADDGTTRRWALAIKTISTKSGQTIFQRISEGARQIDAPTCHADRGIVVINTAGALDHVALWSTPFQHLSDAQDALRGQINRLAEAPIVDRPSSEWEDLFDRKTSPTVIYLGQTVMRVKTLVGDETPSIIKMLVVDQPTKQIDNEAISIAWALNGFMQDITKGIPGAYGKLPK